MHTVRFVNAVLSVMKLARKLVSSSSSSSASNVLGTSCKASLHVGRPKMSFTGTYKALDKVDSSVTCRTLIKNDDEWMFCQPSH